MESAALARITEVFGNIRPISPGNLADMIGQRGDRIGPQTDRPDRRRIRHENPGDSFLLKILNSLKRGPTSRRFFRHTALQIQDIGTLRLQRRLPLGNDCERCVDLLQNRTRSVRGLRRCTSTAPDFL